MIRIDLFKDSERSFLHALDQAGIAYQRRTPQFGVILNSGLAVTIGAVAGSAATALATVLVAWLKARSSRKIIVTLESRGTVQIEGYSVEQVRDLVPTITHLAAIDTRPPTDSPDQREPPAPPFGKEGHK